MAGGDLGLDGIPADGCAEVLGAAQGGEAATDQELVPAGAVLIVEQDGRAARIGPRSQSGRLEFQQRLEPVHLGVVGDEAGQQAGEPDALMAQIRPRPGVALGGGIPLVEDQVDDRQHVVEAVRAFLTGRQFQGDAGVREGAFGPGDPPDHGRLRDQEGTGDLGAGQAADQPEGECRAGLRGEQGVAGEQDQPQHVVLHVVHQLRRLRHRVLLQVVGELRKPPAQTGGASYLIDAAAAGDGEQPGLRLTRDAVPRPALQRGDQGVLGEILGQREVTGEAGERRDDPCRLDPPHRGDGLPRGGLRHAPPSSGGGPKTGRTSTEPSHPGQNSWCRLSMRRACSVASSTERTSRTAYPPTTSFASA